MTREAASALLIPLRRKQIRVVYDIDIVQEAILTLDQRFEYPDWSHRKISEFLKYVHPLPV